VILSAKAKVAKKTLQLFEARQHDPYARTIIALRKTLERAGVAPSPRTAAVLAGGSGRKAGDE
jgi:hypothetical protein